MRNARPSELHIREVSLFVKWDIECIFTVMRPSSIIVGGLLSTNVNKIYSVLPLVATHLKSLSVCGGFWEAQSLDALSTLTSLDTLVLQLNSKLHTTSLHLPPNLETLRLSECGYTNYGISLTTAPSTLTDLTLSNRLQDQCADMHIICTRLTEAEL